MKFELFGTAFWGSLLILIGFLLVMKHMFHLQIPVGRIVISLLFIYLGIRLLIGNFNCFSFRRQVNENSAVFSEQNFTYSQDQKNYSCAFGNCNLDMTHDSITENRELNISVAFGDFKVKIKKGANIEIISSTAFGSTDMPGSSINGFGKKKYKPETYNPNLPSIKIKTNVAFGSLKFFFD